MTQKIRFLTFIAASIRNKPGRNMATLFCFAFIAANIFTAQFLVAGAAGGVDRSVTRMGADHMVVPTQYMVYLRGAGPDNTVAIVMAEPSEFRIKANIMEGLKKIPGIESVSPQLFVATVNLPTLSPAPLNIYGIDPETDFTIQPWLKKPLNHPLGSGEVIIGSAVVGDPGTLISVGDKKYTIVGKLDPTRSSVDHAVILRLEDAYNLANIKGIIPASSPKIVAGDVNAILIRDAPDEKLKIVGDRITRAYYLSPESRTIRVINRHFSLDPAGEDIQNIPGLLNLISVFVVVVALPLIALISAMVAHERQREIGLLKAMGAKRKIIALLIMAESFILSAIGGILGLAASIFMILLLHSTGDLAGILKVTLILPSTVETGLMAIITCFCIIIIGTFSSLYPAYRGSQMNPYEAIREGV